MSNIFERFGFGEQTSGSTVNTYNSSRPGKVGSRTLSPQPSKAAKRALDSANRFLKAARKGDLTAPRSTVR